MSKVLNKIYPSRTLIFSKQKILTKDENYQSLGIYGKRPEERTVEELLENGIVILDKHPGPTSHDLVHWIKRITNVSNTGHGGTLDPKVSGVLLVLLGKATKLQFLCQSFPKEYVMLMKIYKELPEEEILKVVKEFEGDIYQKPPLRSAVKKRIRIKRVYYIEVLEINGKEILMLLGVESGTYARKLAYDIGRALGVGGHMIELRRTKVGNFTEKEAVPLYKFLDAYYLWKDYKIEKEIRNIVKPIEYLVKDLPKIWIKDGAVSAFCHGATLKAPGVVKLTDDITPGNYVAVMSMKDELVGIGEALKTSEEILKLEKGDVIKPKRIIMDRNVYPKIWKKEENINN